MKETALITIDNFDVVKTFATTESVKALLAKLKTDAEAHVPDVESTKGREAIASNAYRVSRSKVLVEKEGKKLGAEWAKKKKLLDADLRIWREGCDKIRDDVRQPLTDYENAEKARIEALTKAKEYELDWKEAHEIQDLLIREAEVKRKEQELADKEEARLAEEKKAQLIKEQKEREEQIAKAAAEKARRDTEDRIAKEKEDARQLVVKAQMEKEAAAEKAEANRKAADVEHQREINNIVYASLVRVCQVDQATAKYIVQKVATGQVKKLKIEY